MTKQYIDIVNCCECKHWLKDKPECTEFVGYCELAGWMTGEAGYCIYGEKKEKK